MRMDNSKRCTWRKRAILWRETHQNPRGALTALSYDVHMSQQPPRPQAIRVLGVLNAVFAGLGVLGLLMTYAMYFTSMKLGPRNPVIELAHDSPAYMSFLRWSFVIGAARILLMAASGIGLLKMKPWARKATLACAFYSIVAGIGSAIATYQYLIVPLQRHSDPGSTGGAYGGAAGIVISFVYPIVLLVFMMKKDVREALERAADSPIPPARVQ
jgi:hypothetical protein